VSTAARSLAELHILESLSRGDSGVHRLRPLAKLITTVLYLVAIGSTGRREVVGLLPFVLYPVIILSLAGLPAKPFVKRIAAVSPLVLLIGVLNPVFDRSSVSFGGYEVAGGWLVFASISLKCVLAVWAALLLVATTGMDGVAEAMRSLRLPRVFVLQTLLAYRYVSLLIEEVATSLRAHELRSQGRRGVGKEARGSLPGRLLVRTYERGVRIHEAMQLRGFDGEYRAGGPKEVRAADLAFVGIWLAFFACARFIDIPLLLGSLVVKISI
jgi:cobalt/nickel transport system permease protein